MTRRVSRRTGKPYTQGSHRERGTYPKTCHACGEKTRLDDCWQETTAAGEQRMYHHPCRLAAVKEAPMPG